MNAHMLHVCSQMMSRLAATRGNCASREGQVEEAEIRHQCCESDYQNNCSATFVHTRAVESQLNAAICCIQAVHVMMALLADLQQKTGDDRFKQALAEIMRDR